MAEGRKYNLAGRRYYTKDRDHTEDINRTWKNIREYHNLV
jgi:hypothetical protein